MKTIVVGDIHGRNCWKKIVNQPFDKVVFLGDYVDSKEGIYPVEQKHNLLEIIDFKKNNKDKAVLLIGNHDFHYFSFSRKNYSGYQSAVRFDFQEIFEKSLREQLIQMCHSQGKFLFTHAGLSRTWSKNNFGKEALEKGEVEEKLNELFFNKPLSFDFTSGMYIDPYGNEACQTPIWIRPEALREDFVRGYVHVVGHTIQHDSVSIEKNIILNDALSIGQYLIIENNVPRIAYI